MLPSRSINCKYRYLRGIGNKLVSIESCLPLDIKWAGAHVNFDQVAVACELPFAIILGVDWIIESKTDFLVREGQLVLKPSSNKLDPAEKKKRRVRFLGIEESPLCDETEQPTKISDELIACFKNEAPPKRSRALSAHVVTTVSIPGETLLFCDARLSRRHTGTALVRNSHCFQPGKSWIIPSCLVAVDNGKFKIPIVNLGSAGLQLRRRDLLA